ncbi:putative lipoprotein [Fibrobacter succinogenes subsp. succinogenes S85]|uniref:Putative lipoprotein n=1 Tax=Fibrobacter succinogenes (strain ATCC 19169 / S85) TaxID=59374 RepID=C9RM78_FIBSS|nr:hypothetical protein [Fibrobacter succinogenes]ACX74240.1 hypothetical protein Fisuc_0628 [Fibrobacter succinogenes subsp. succinogenes S85]ADL24671.1 putative lipoprotein [Fibrobacter succinogenes subsp. succinogenes S85]
MFRRILDIAASALLFGFVACSDDNPSGSFDVPAYGNSSSSVETVPGSSDGVGMSSSVVGGESSSSVIVNSSSSAKTPKNTAACLWRGFDKKTYVNTGFVNEDLDNYAGLWYNFGDDPDGGTSSVVFPDVCAFETPEYECMENLLEYYGGYSGAIVLQKGILNEAFAGVGFNVAGVENPEEYYTKHIQRYGDISDWGGVCVTYAADRDMFLWLGADSVTFYEVKLDKSLEFVEKCVPWSEFVGATAKATSTAAEAAKHAHSIRVVMKSSEETKGHFNIAAIGKFDAMGACEVDGFAEVVSKFNGGAEVGTIILRSSSSSGVNGSSSSFTPSHDCVSPESVSEMWYGPKAVNNNDYHVETGLDNGSETSGYWFSFGDDMSGVGSVKLPQPLGIEYPTGDEIYDYCMGACGELQFAKEGYLGIGFHVAGVVDPLDGDLPAAKANISSWGGLCVTYASDSDLEVVLAYTQEGGFGNLSRMPKMTLPKSIKLKTVCADWDNFMTVFSEVSTTFMTSILFAVQGEANAKSRINIRGLGKYSEKTNFCSTGEDPFVSGKKGLVIK